MAIIKSQGTVIAVGAVGGPYNAVGQVTAITGIGKGAFSEIDTTDLDSTGMEFILGLPESTELSMTINFDPDDTYHTEMRTAQEAGTKKGFTITLTDTTATVITLSAYVTTFTYDVSQNEKLVGNVTLKYSPADYSVA